MQSIGIVSVDFQKDFSAEGGMAYRPRPCADFIKDVLIPEVRMTGLRIAEIVSDYRLPRLGDEFECCVPGTTGYESEIPEDVKHPRVWVKCMNSPGWVRENGGWSREMDCPPSRWFDEPWNQGDLKGSKLDRARYDEMLSWYYELRGWDENGIPQKKTLERLGLGDLALGLRKNG